MRLRDVRRIGSIAAIVLLAGTLASKPARASSTIDIYDGIGSDFGPLDTYFTAQGYTVNSLTSTFSSLTGASFVILSEPASITSTQLSLLDAYVDGGGHLLLNSEYIGYNGSIPVVNSILASLGSSIVDQSTSSVPGYHDTSDIVSSPFTAGVTDVNYGDTSSLTGGTALVYGDPGTDDGQDFISYQAIGSGYVFVIADSDTADNINSTTSNNNGVLYCDIGGLSCAANSTPPSTTPEPSSLLLFGTGLLGLGGMVRRKFFA